jgi:hypothetical protein
MFNTSLGAALGFVILTFLTSSITFVIVVFGVILRRKILLWDDHWKETIESTGVTIGDFADDLERSFIKVRSTYRLLGFFVIVIVVLMGVVVYAGLIPKPVLEAPQVSSSLWLLLLVALSAILPAFVSYAVGTYMAETMLLKANAFAYLVAKDDYREKKAKMQMVAKAKELRAKREALKNTPAASPGATPEPAKPATAQPTPPAGPAAKATK